MRTVAVAAALALAALAAPAAAQQEGAPLNPHTREACIQCHKAQGKPLGPGRTGIYSSREEPHAVLAGACRPCHKEGKEDFWLLVLPQRGAPRAGAAASGPAQPPSAPAPAPAPGAPAVIPEPKAPTAPLRETAPAPAPGGGEGFENSHDAMDCAGCHEKPADQLRKGAATPPKFAAQGVEAFCRSCHSGVDRSHYPRGNLPRAGTTCLNCHRAHGRSLLFPALRDDFPQFLTDSTTINPHGGKVFCLACHPDTPQKGQPVAFRYPGNSLQLCRRCHPGVEHHPLGVKSTQATWKMDFAHFPLENESITCVTCHKPPECLGTLGRENPRFLRGGPYNAAEEFCARCHEGKKFSSLNPHDQVSPSGEIYQKKCLYCHVTMPSLTASGAEMRFTDTMTALCVSCHQSQPHPERDHLVPLPRAMLDNLRKYEERRIVRLPLEEGDVITCVTCHNPHARGLLKGAAGVGADEEHRLRLTTTNEICTPCHGRH
jgi:hypothetical protein